MTQYGKKTEVPVSRSQAELREVLRKYGADDLMTIERGAEYAVRFTMLGKHLRFVIAPGDITEFQFTHTEAGRVRPASDKQRVWEQDLRARWRVFVMTIRMKLEACLESGVLDFEQEMMPYVLLSDGETVGERYAPQVDEYYRSGSAMTEITASAKLLTGPKA